MSRKEMIFTFLIKVEYRINFNYWLFCIQNSKKIRYLFFTNNWQISYLPI